jgi:hypothetical protein
MKTSENSQETNSNPLTSSAEVSHAKTSARPESEPGSPIQTARQLAAAFGLNSPASLGFFDPDGFSLRTSQACLFQEQSEELSETWPDSGMWDAGNVYELQTSELRTCENEFSLWPTTRSSSGGGNKSGYEGAPYRPALAQLSQTWNTPSTEDHKTDERGEALTCDMRLRNQAQTWPTARQADGESCGNHPGAVDSLTGATRLWPTPMSVPDSEASHNQLSGQYRRQMDEALSLWNTPRTITGGGESAERKQELGREESGGGDLQAQTQHWKTPHGMGNEDFRGKKGGAGGGEFALQANNWQIPATDSFRSRGGDRKDEQGLDQQARMFPMPASRDYRTPNLKPGPERGMGSKGEQLQNFVEHHYPSLPAPAIPDGPQSSKTVPTSRRRLSPRFVEWLMGFPVTWTEL